MGTIWLELDTSELLTEEYMLFMSFLDANDMKYTSYLGGKGVFLEVKGETSSEYNKVLSQFIYYQAIEQLDIAPDVSDYDIWEEMSNAE